MSLFNHLPVPRIKRNKFDLSHERKMTLKMGTLTPFYLEEVMPGDAFRVKTEMMLRLQPLLAPIMHRVRVKTDFFFVPNRLVWDNWQNFITGGEKGNAAVVHPYIQFGESNKNNLEKGTLADYLGLPTLKAGDSISAPYQVSAIPFRAYQLIYNEYYRDQNLIDPVTVLKTDGNDQSADALVLRKRSWEKDYFTSALPNPQKGGAVNMPATMNYHDQSLVIKTSDGTRMNGDLNAGANIVGGVTADSTPVRIENIDGIDMTVNDLRRAVRIQEWLEKNARAGSRYIESILSHFGVLSSDARLQRPEYLGGGVNPVVISEVVSTFQVDTPEADTSYPQGHMAGHGISTGNISGFKRKFEEHGFIFGIMTVLPRTAYSQGIHRSFTRFDKFDYAWPSFAQLGEQAIMNKEILFSPNNAGANDGTFGYQSRYAEYKYKPSTIHGDMRENLAFWHMGRIFEGLPVLNQSFLEPENSTLRRPFAIQDETQDDCIVQVYNRVDALRPLPYFNTPTL